MAQVRRHESLPLRFAAVALALGLVLAGARSHAQVDAPGGTSPVDAVPPQGFPPSPETAPLVAPHEHVVDIRVVGNSAISREKVLANIGTRVGHPFDPTTYERDIRKLSTKNWFVHVTPRTERVAGGIVITLEVVERPILQYVKYIGNVKVKSAKTLSKETGLKKGDPLDTFAIQDGARKLESYYQAKGFNSIKVSVLEGTKPGDKGAVYLINEGKIQKFSTVKFEGNSYSIAPDGRLKTMIQSKPPLFWLFKGQVDPKKIEEDVQKLEVYYRGLGFFKAHIGREYEFNEKEDKVSLVFHINEGPRYQVRNISFLGNKIYPEEAFATQRKMNGGDYFDQNKMNTDIGIVKDLYGSNGYVFADVVAELKFDEEPGFLDVIYQVSEGDQYRIGEISVVIKGDNAHTRHNTVLNRLSMRPGDIADIRDFRSSERRLKLSGLYNVDPSKGDTPKIVFSPPDAESVANNNKKRASGKRTGDPDSFRGQSPDDWVAEEPDLRSDSLFSGATDRRPSPDDWVDGEPDPTSNGVVLWPTDLPTGDYERKTRAPLRSQQLPAKAMPRQGNPVQPDGSVVRGQSPDGSYGGYGGGYGGRANPLPASPQPYTVNQPASPTGAAPYTAAPPSGTQYAQQPAYPPPPAYTQPPAGGGYAQPGYPPPGPPLPAPPGYSNPPLLEPPGSILGSPPLNQPTIPVEVVVNEAQTGKFMFGAGVNSNAGLVGSIVVDEQNFDIRRFPTGWEDVRSGRAFRGAGQKFRVEAAPGTQVSRYLFNFAEPYLFDTPVSYGLSGYYFNRFYRNWNEQRAGGRTSLGYQFTPDLSGNIALRAEDILISNPSPANPPTVPALAAVIGHTQLYSVKPQISYDTRDSTFLPTQGMFLSTDFEYAFGTFQFPRYMLNFQKHFLARERPDGTGRHVISFYTQFGISGNDTPIYERFYAGGFGTLRGYQFRGASPIIDGVQVGGELLNVNSLEYMFPITADDMLKGVVFVDYGTVEQTRTITWDNYRIAPGLGLRVTIPMISLAPIALDFAFPVHSAPTDLHQTFSFFVGVGH
jgi:outer membrane protein insertion porin family